MLAIPLGWLAWRFRLTRGLLLTVAGLLYTIPSLALHHDHAARCSACRTPAAAPRPASSSRCRSTRSRSWRAPPPTPSARWMPGCARRRPRSGTPPGSGSGRSTSRSPGPVLLAGLRVVAVSTIALVTVGVITGVKSLGYFFTDGFQRQIVFEVLTGVVLTDGRRAGRSTACSCSPGAPCCRGRAPSRARSASPLDSAVRRRRMNLISDTIAWLARALRQRRALGPHRRAAVLHRDLGADRLGDRDPGRLLHRAHRAGSRDRGRHLGGRACPAVVRSHPAARLAGRGAAAADRGVRRVRDPRDAVDPRGRVLRASRRSTASTIDAARAMGMTEWQILWKVEAPLGLHLLVGGLRSGTLQVIATVTLAAYINLGGLGYDILQGIPLRRDEQVLGAAVVVIALALLIDGSLRRAHPRRRSRHPRRRPASAAAPADSATCRPGARRRWNSPPAHEKEEHDVHSKEQGPARLDGSRGRGGIDPGRVRFEHWRRLRRRGRRRRQGEPSSSARRPTTPTRSSPRSTRRLSRTPASR